MNTKFNEVKNILWNLYDAVIKADAFEGIDDKIKCRDMLTHFAPYHRELVVEYLADAKAIAEDPTLQSLNNAAEWAVELQHVLDMMDEPDFWPTV